MGQFSVEKPGLPGSVLSGNQQDKQLSAMADMVELDNLREPESASTSDRASSDD